MRYSSLVQRIAGEGAAAWDIHYEALERKQNGEDIILLSVGDPDFDTPQPIVQSAIDNLRKGNTHYADHRGDFDLRQAIAEHFYKQTQHKVSAQQVTVQVGAQCALYSVAQCILEPGDEVIVPDPMYVTYEATLESTGACIVNVPMQAEQGFHFQVTDIANAITAKTKAIVINSPHNPTGSIVSQLAWKQIASLCLQHDLWLVIDEVYAQLVYDQKIYSPVSIDGMAERTAIVGSLSKSHAMTGWRVGWVIANEELSGHLANLSLCMIYGCSSFAQKAAVTALTRPIDEIDNMHKAYKQRRDVFYQLLQKCPDIKAHLPEGGMFIMIDIRSTGLSAQDFAAYLLKEYGVSVLAGEAFGTSAAGHVRCSLCVELLKLREAASRIINCVEQLLITRCQAY